MDLQQPALQYDPLGDSEIRLVKFRKDSSDADHPEPDPDTIELQLEHFRTDDVPVYLALSYVWGDANDTRPVNVNGQPFDVTQNLYQALVHIHRLVSCFEDGLCCVHDNYEVGLFLWIDAICINQKSVDERSKQVPRMTEVYSSAYNVLIWLGPIEGLDMNPREFEIFLTFARVFTSFADFQEFRPEPEAWDPQQYSNDDHGGVGLVLGYCAILENEWFRRVWTVQEYALSKHEPFVLLGEELFPFGPLYDMGEMLLKKLKENIGLVPNSSDVLMRILENDIRRSFGRRNLREWIASDQFQNKPWADQLLCIMTNFWFKSCTDPRDQVYGLLGMVNIAQIPRHLLPDYRKSFAQVCKDYMRCVIENTRDLRMLQFIAGCEPFQGQPSWVIDLRYQPPERHEAPTLQAELLFLNGESLSLEGKRAGRVLTYSIATGDDPAKSMQQFCDTILATAAEIRRVPLAEVWKEWLSYYLLEFSNHPTSYASRYRDLPEFLGTSISGHQPDDNAEEMEVVRGVALGAFSMREFALIENGLVLSCIRHERYSDNTDHEVFAFKGSIKYSIVQKEGPDQYRYLGWLREGSVDDILNSDSPVERITLI